MPVQLEGDQKNENDKELGANREDECTFCEDTKPLRCLTVMLVL